MTFYELQGGHIKSGSIGIIHDISSSSSVSRQSPASGNPHARGAPLCLCGFYSKVTACDISGCRRQPLHSIAAIPPTIYRQRQGLRRYDEQCRCFWTVEIASLREICNASQGMIAGEFGFSIKVKPVFLDTNF